MDETDHILDPVLKVPAQTTALVEPCERPLDDPTARQHREPLAFTALNSVRGVVRFVKEQGGA